MKNRLIELITEAKVQRVKDYFEDGKIDVIDMSEVEYVVDYLLKHGVTISDTDEPEPMKNILVVYQCDTKQGNQGVGRCSIKTSAKLPLSIDSIKKLEADLEKQFHYKNVVLLNYFLLGDE